ncbi:MAG TPA: VWA domain-containing protein [Pyrinomonadaceae bacterium]|nr:VWA domain-containing protein [Pyrinomonadaceae bacterium]
MKRILNRTFGLACAFCVLQVAAQTPAGPKVELSLIVTDKANKPVNTINKADIRVIEDKVEQTVLGVEADERPVDCALVIDTSGSFRSLIASSLEMTRLLIVNRRPDDEIFIERFVSSDLIQTLHDFTRDGNALIESLKNIRIEAGQSAVIDALHVAAQHLAKHNKSIERRKALVIITDGEDRNSFYKQEQLIKLLREEGIQVFILGLVVDLDREGGLIRASPREKAEKLLQTVAEETGGRVFYPKDKAELVEATVQIINHLRGQFRITYQSTNSTGDGFRKVEVKVISPSGEKRNAIVPRGYVPAKAKEQSHHEP